jgi:GNAT superfamily N-acetyltransferase
VKHLTPVTSRSAPRRRFIGVMAVALRELTPSDRNLLALIFERLGPQSRIQRFLGPKPELPDHDLIALSAVDGSRHFGVIAFAGSPESPIGVARCVRSDEDFEVAETAIEVVDEWQRRGVGRLLLAALRARALEAGVRRFEWFALDSNRAMCALTRGLRDRRHSRVGDGVIKWSAAVGE